MATWHDKTSLRAQWSNAPKLDSLLDELLAVAKYQVIEFGPALTPPAEGEPEDIPERYRLAQMLQARALWESLSTNTAGDVDAIGGEYQVRVYPMSATIKSVLRPSTAFGVIG